MTTKTYKEKLLAAGINAPAAEYLDNPGANGNTNIVTAQVNNLTGVITFSAGQSSVIMDQVATGYFCHLWAGSSSNGDGAIPDISGNLSPGVFASGLTKALA